MPIVLDRDAQEYLRLRREQSVMSDQASLSVDALRAEERRLRTRYGHGPVLLSEREIPASASTPRHLILDPVAEVEGVLVYFHGGGWVMGEPEDYLAVCRALAAESRWRVIVADYRKAPEHPFPAAFEDALALVEHVRIAARDGAGPLPLAVGGDSAGGNLAAAVSHDLGLRHPGTLAAQLLVTPVLDTVLDTESHLDPARQLTLTRELMAWFWELYAPAADGNDPRLAPLRVAGMSHLPATIFISAGTDVLWSEGRQYLTRLQDAGVRVIEREYPGQMHGFFQLYNVMDASRDAVVWAAQCLAEVAAPVPDDSEGEGDQHDPR